MTKLNISQLREEYSRQSLDEKDVHSDPLKQFKNWFETAIKAEIKEPNAMHLSTLGKGGRPRGRIVLLKDLEENAFVFYTNYNSHKGQELQNNPLASLTFFWPELERQIRIEGRVEKVSEEKSIAYFLSRPRESQIGAWVSAQSEQLNSRDSLEEKKKSLEKAFLGKELSKPDYWGGFALKADYLEFWQGRPGRLHDRIAYQAEARSWKIYRLSP